jgi:arginyl-tRNA synthetase
MSFIKDKELLLKHIIESLGYKKNNISLNVSSRRGLGDYQFDGVMSLAKENHQNPLIIANEIKEKLEQEATFINVNIAGPGFINLSFKKEALIAYMNRLNNNLSINIDQEPPKNILLDYGGANAAKALHVGHLRSANIGEALKRLAKTLGHHVLADVHLGDLGRQIAMVIYETKVRKPELIYFDDHYGGPYPSEAPLTAEELEEYYPSASKKAKESEEVLEAVRAIDAALQSGHPGYNALWDHIIKVSSVEIKKTYNRFNTSFDLWEGEKDSFAYIDETLAKINESKLAYLDQGATIIDVSEPDDKLPIPPFILLKSDGSTLYSTREIATLYSRVKRFPLDEIWYFTDKRQELHFNQTFRAAYKTKIVPPSINLQFFGFGTMNGPDGTPFKTRDGSVMKLDDLFNLVNQETYSRLGSNIPDNEKEGISEMVAVAAIKYADLLPNINKDYVFDPVKFSDIEGKTGPYLLYSTMRIKSLLKKAELDHIEKSSITDIYNEDDREIILEILNMPAILTSAYHTKSLNDICDYLYRLNNTYNKFYANNRILTEEDQAKRASWLTLSSIVYQINTLLLDILAIKVPDKM